MFKCSKSIYHISSCILFFCALLIIPCLSFNCIHEEVNGEVKRSISTRSVKYQDIRAQRDKNPNLFEALDVFFYLDNIDSSISHSAVHNIKLALGKVKEFIQSTFQVRKREKPYLLQRKSCTAKWQSGKNRGKCSTFSNASELCHTLEINYVIPDKFLDKLEVYDFDKSHPKFSIAAGPGLFDSNFIAFVLIQPESICTEHGIMAFGSYCRLDLKTSEPLAAILNLCPSAFVGRSKNIQFYYNVILHEMFHALGFSMKLFDKFVPCEKGTYCPMPQKIFQEDESKIFRMMFPLVIENMQSHFDCSKPDFGAPMAVKENQTEDNIQYSSHWHPVLMYSSIMAPSFTETDDVLVDKITLAALASTGWYHVNFSKADDFKFGSGQGCNFGLSNGSCDNNDYLCNPRYENYGCDLHHKTIGRCENITSDHPCGVFVPNSKKNCEGSMAKYPDIDFTILGYKEKCFMQRQSNSSFQPSCLPVRCKTENTYNVLINMTWYPCFKRGMILSQNVTTICPDSVLFCQGTTIPIPVQFCPSEIYFFIAVRMYFDRPTFQELSTHSNFKNFKAATLKEIANQIEIPLNYIVNSSLSVFKKIFLDFAICPPAYLNSKELNAILWKTQKFLDGSFVSILEGTSNQFISSNNIKIDPIDVISFSDHDGFRSFLIFPVVCAIFLIASFVASILRLLLVQTYRPKRVMENTENLQLSQINSL